MEIPIPFVGEEIDTAEGSDAAIGFVAVAIGWVLFYGARSIGFRAWEGLGEAFGMGDGGGPEVL